MDSELPNTDCAAEPLLDGVREGKIDMDLLDRSVRHILKLKFELGLFENPFVDPDTAAAALTPTKTVRLHVKLRRKRWFF